MPDPIIPSGQQTTQPPTPDTTQQTQTAPAQTTPQTPPPDTTQVQTAQVAPTFRDQVSKYGFDASRYQSDDDAMRALVEQVRLGQSQQHFAQLGQQVMPQYGEFQNFLKQQEAAKAAEQAKQAKWWDAPKHDPTWENQIERDQTTGELKLRPGAAPDALVNYQRFRDHVAKTNIAFAQDPLGMLKPGLEPMIKEITQALIKEQLGGFQQQQSIEQLHRRDVGWLYEQDQQGKVRYGADNQPVQSLAGQIMDRQLKELEADGYKPGPRMWEKARELTWATLERAKQQQAAGTQQQTQQATQQTNGNGPINRLQNLGNTEAAAAGVGQGGNTGQSLGDRLRQNFKAGNVSDADFQ